MGWRHHFYEHSRSNHHRLTGYLFLLIAGVCLVMSAIAASRMKPLLERVATARVSNSVTQVVAEAVDEAIQSGAIQYQQLVSFEKDLDGRITALHSNMAAFNRLQSMILDTIMERIGEVSSRDLSIPLGNLTGSALLAGRGPRIRVRMESMGSSTARFENEFISAGINQTKHQIVLHIDVYVTILLPGMTTATKVSNAITVAETVIVGTVPQTYTYFAPDPALCQEDAKDYVLNKG